MHPFMGIEDWDRVGISVEQSAKRLQRIAFIDREVMRIEAAHMIARPEYELKGALGRMNWQDALHHDQLRLRCKQLRMSTFSFDKCPDDALLELTNRTLESATSLALLASLFEIIKPAQIEAINQYLQVAQPIVDEPTMTILRHQLIEREEQIRWGLSALKELQATESPEVREKTKQWKRYIRSLLDAAGGVHGTAERKQVDPALVVASEPFVLPKFSVREDRVKTEMIKLKGITFGDTDDDRFKMMMFTRFFEMSPAEAVAHIQFSTKGKPWNFYLDTARHLWDEVRHSWFGQAALRTHGYEIYSYPHWTGWYDMTSNAFEQDEAYTHLTITIEKGAMKYPPGKREEWEFCRDVAKDPLMTTFQDFDWADEVVHAGFGQRWVVDELYGGDNRKAQEAADATLIKRKRFFSRYDEKNGDHTDWHQFFRGEY
ncbi:hypothetical protein [Ammoniphilus sp. YIM 78166]|uniref:hypothetical protein n=1 Tax=Ammoniphilus sp. YIM 78166 TaxID=1644106 RepID=UPI00106F503D|nr:hypothetical protein [Ammoniphilus sp. YIM 78166]